MLNLAPIFSTPIALIENGSKALKVPGLPHVIYFMQVDVLNHYKHAINNYFAISLDEEYLQNSSIGTPYPKWQKFSAENWSHLEFTTFNLIRYTSRLYWEIAFKNQFRDKPVKVKYDATESNLFTTLLCHKRFKNQKLGLYILDNETVEIYSIKDISSIDSSTELRTVNISDRDALEVLWEEGQSEIKEITALHTAFKKACQKRLKAKYIPHDSLFDDFLI